jgi:A/G-specific adenine glycosylase
LTEQVQQLLEQMPSDFSFGRTLVAWYRLNRRDLPWRSLFAQTGDPYAVWVSEIMLQQTTIQAVLPAYQRFLKIFPDVRSLAAADEEAVRLACRGLGYYRRFRMMHAAARELVVRSRPKAPIKWPRDFLAWRELPGIGDYTAAAIASIVFGQAKAVVDGNVERVFCRLWDLRVVPDLKWKRIFQIVGDRLIAEDAPGDFNQGLMELGQTVCTKQNPNCSICPLEALCQSRQRNSQNLAPQTKKAIIYEDVALHLLVMHRGHDIGLVARRQEARFLAGTLGFPTAISLDDGKWLWECEGEWPEPTHAIGSIKHAITRHRIEAHVYPIEAGYPVPDMVWVPFVELESRLVSNLDRKALQLVSRHRPLRPAPGDPLLITDG